MKYYRVILKNAVMESGRQEKIYFNPITGLLFYVRPEGNEFRHVTSLTEWSIIIDLKIYEEITLEGVKVLAPVKKK